MFNEDFCAGSEQFICGAVAPEAADGKHACCDGGLHIGIGVAEVEDLFVRDIELPDNSHSQCGVGLQGDIGKRALDDFELPLREELFDDDFCEAVIFIR